MENTVVGIDLAKSSFQIHEATERGRALKSKKLNRSQLLSYLRLEKPKVLYMEACGSAHYWARKAKQLGHTPHLIAPQYVKPFVKRHKTDAADAEAIVEAGTRDNMHFVPLKSVQQQDLQAIHRIRQRLIEERTRLMNQIRGLLAEYGVAITKGYASLKKTLIELLETRDHADQKNHDLTPIMYEELCSLQEEMNLLNERIDRYEKKLEQLANQDERCQRLQTVPGVGPITAAALVAAVGSVNVFKNARQMAAWIGLTPRQHSTGGTARILGISKAGNKDLRTLLIHGGRAVLMNAGKKKDRRSQWVVELKDRVGMNKAAVAMAHKNIRTIYALLKHGTVFDDHYQPKLIKIISLKH